MTRQQKFPETSTFHYFNANPHNRKSGDCVIRAICTALEQSWEQTLRELCEIGLKYGYCPTDTHTYSKYLEGKGWKKHAQPRKTDNTKYTGEEWCEWLNKNDNRNKRIICHIGGHHIVCIAREDPDPLFGDDSFKVYDIWDSTDGCIGNYWTK